MTMTRTTAIEAARAWVDIAIFENGAEDEWREMDWGTFKQAVENANAPAFPDCGVFAGDAIQAAWFALHL